jgi:hypothetical protein
MLNKLCLLHVPNLLDLRKHKCTTLARSMCQIILRGFPTQTNANGPMLVIEGQRVAGLNPVSPTFLSLTT